MGYRICHTLQPDRRAQIMKCRLLIANTEVSVAREHNTLGVREWAVVGKSCEVNSIELQGHVGVAVDGEHNRRPILGRNVQGEGGYRPVMSKATTLPTSARAFLPTTYGSDISDLADRESGSRLDVFRLPEVEGIADVDFVNPAVEVTDAHEPAVQVRSHRSRRICTSHWPSAVMPRSVSRRDAVTDAKSDIRSSRERAR